MGAVGTFVVAYLVGINGMSLCAMGLDKLAARHHGARIRQRFLYTLALAGGWPAGVLGMLMFRHKTRKTDFLVVYACMALLHVGLLLVAAAHWWLVP